MSEAFYVTCIDVDGEAVEMTYRGPWNSLELFIDELLFIGFTEVQIVTKCLRGTKGVTCVYVDGQFTKAAKSILEDVDVMEVA